MYCTGSVCHLSLKPGESFERAMAYIMGNAGFIVRETPHQVKVSGEVVGDFDVLAVDPKSNTTIAVTCKEWKDQPPQTKDFNHFMSLMDIEGVKHGIVAWTYVPKSVYPLIQNAEKRGYRIAILDIGQYEKLNVMMLDRQVDRIEEFFRRELGLVPSATPTVGQEIALRKEPATKRKRVDCVNFLPMHYGPDPPAYVRNAYFRPSEAILEVIPCLLARFHAYKEARFRGELQGEINQEVVLVCDAITGKYAEQDSRLWNLIRNHYTEALKHFAIDEEDFTVQRHEPKINRQETVYKMRVDAARSFEPLKVTWSDSQGEDHEKSIELSPGDLRELYAAFVDVPIWRITYRLGSHQYAREFFATDSTTLRDEMVSCKACDRQTAAVCTKCGSTLCEEHTFECKICSRLFCGTDLFECANCKSMFCGEHAVGKPCIKCGQFVCSEDDVQCSTCKQTLCQDHKVTCMVCGKIACDEHKVEVRYVGLKKKFCSDKCRAKFDKEYKQSGKLGKLGKAFKRHHTTE